MPNLESFAETSDFFAEYAGHYLGCGSVLWTLDPQALELRRDAGAVLRRRSVRSIKWHLTLLLAGGDQIWGIFAQDGEVAAVGFAGGIFADGRELKLYPADPLQRGFVFKRACLEKITRDPGSSAGAALKLDFVCEAISNGKYLERLTPGSLPQNVKSRTIPDLPAISRQLLEHWGQKLDMTVGSGITLNTFNAGNHTAMLKLVRCKNWQFNVPQEFDFVLRCRCLPARFAEMENALYAAAVELNDYHPTTDGALWACRVKNLEFGSVKNIKAADILESTLEFSAVVR